MKKLLILILLPFIGISQVKIGEITITEQQAKEYFLDCYNNPDTIDGKVNNYVETDFEKELRKIAIRQLYDTVLIKAHYDTTFNYPFVNPTPFGRLSYSQYLEEREKVRNISRKSGISSIKYIPDRTRIIQTHFYLVPRKPSEIDYIKYIKRKT